MANGTLTLGGGIEYYGVIYMADGQGTVPATGACTTGQQNNVFTVEGITLALQRLAPDGLLAIPLRLDLPPRHLTRMLATIKAALARHGTAAPGAHVAALRGLQTHLLLVSPLPLMDADTAALRTFARGR